MKHPSYEVSTLITSIVLVGKQKLRERRNNVPVVTHFTSGGQASNTRPLGSMLTTTVVSPLPEVPLTAPE